ncbi:hypothetical protein [Cellulomonas hominis]|uniref:hypothetical protein n=1 Tax=Cellulomonas hominis TaxID=156981 RepID=UPI001BCC8571|nr:hypothetical protein [Cellulomonas hominis]
MAVLVLSAITSCALVPSDPLLPPVGLRVDGDVITVLIPQCPGQGVVSARVEQLSGEDTWAAVWEASDFTGAVPEGVRLDGEDWAVVDGSYAGADTLLDVTVDTSDTWFGAGRVDVREIRDLPPGQFDVDHELMGRAEYDALVSDFPCPVRSPQRGAAP